MYTSTLTPTRRRRRRRQADASRLAAAAAAAGRREHAERAALVRDDREAVASREAYPG